MQENILKSLSIQKIQFVYIDGKGFKKKEIVNLRYMDRKSCYLITSAPASFNTPKWRTKAEITVYTPDGFYTTKVIIRDASITQSELIFEVDLPKTWELKQLRVGNRRKIELPLLLNFSDGSIVDTKLCNISIGGFAFINDAVLTTVQKSLPAKAVISLPEGLVLNFPEGVLETSVKFVRYKSLSQILDLPGYYLYAFKFISLTQEQELVLKSYLMK